MKRMSIILATIAVLATGVVSYVSLASQTVPTATAPRTQSTVQTLSAPTVQELLDAVNTERAKAGVAPLVLHAALTQSAQWKADDMHKRNYTAHADPETGRNNGLDYLDSIDGGSCGYVSENYYYANGSHRTTAGALNWWMNSKMHHDAILDPRYNTTGFGVAWGEKMIIVEHFCIAK